MRRQPSPLTEKEIERILELSKEMNVVQISQETKRSPQVIRERLREAGIEPLRYCIDCEKNLPPGDFENGKKQLCMRHEPKTPNKKPFIQDYNEHLAKAFIAEIKPLQARWPATNPGEFKNHYVGLSEGP